MRTVSLTRIVTSDYVSVVLIALVVVAWGLAALDASGIRVSRRSRPRLEEKPHDSAVALWLALGATCCLGPVAGHRITSRLKLARSGAEVQGRITRVWFERDRGRIEYTFEMGGKTYENWQAIFKNDRTSQFQDGAPLTLLVDEANPDRVLIRDLVIG